MVNTSHLNVINTIVPRIRFSFKLVCSECDQVGKGKGHFSFLPKLSEYSFFMGRRLEDGRVGPLMQPTPSVWGDSSRHNSLAFDTWTPVEASVNRSIFGGVSLD